MAKPHRTRSRPVTWQRAKARLEKGQKMLTHCLYCELNTAGEHAPNCPMNTNDAYEMGRRLVREGFADSPLQPVIPTLNAYARIAELEAQHDTDAAALAQVRAERDELRKMVDTPEMAYVRARRQDLQNANMKLLVTLKEKAAAVALLQRWHEWYWEFQAIPGILEPLIQDTDAALSAAPAPVDATAEMGGTDGK